MEKTEKERKEAVDNMVEKLTSYVSQEVGGTLSPFSFAISSSPLFICFFCFFSGM